MTAPLQAESSFWQSNNWISPSGYIALGASPPTSGAIRVDAASYSNNVLVAKNGTASASLILVPNASFYIGPTTNNDMNFMSGGLTKWVIQYAAAGTAIFKSNEAIAQITGGATSLALTNNANNANNLYVADAGGILLRGATGGVPSVGVINAQGFKINGVDVGTSSATYWNAGVSGGIYYSAGTVGIGGGENASYALNILSTGLTGAAQYGITVGPTFTALATTGTNIYSALKTAAAAYTLSIGYAIRVDIPTLGAGSAISNMYGLRISNQGATGITNAYGIYIDAQSGAATTNVGLNNAGSTILSGLVSLNGGSASYGLYLTCNTLVGSSQYGAFISPSFPAVATVFGVAGYFKVTTAAAVFTMTEANAIYTETPALGAGSAISTNIGIKIRNQGASGITTAYGLYIAAQSGASGSNIGLYNAGTSQFIDTIGIGAVPSAANGILLSSTLVLAGASQTGVYIAPVFTSSATSNGIAGQFKLTTAAAAFTMVSGHVLYADTPTVGAGSAITTQYGLRVLNQGASGITNAYGVHIAAQSGAATTNIGLYNGGTSQLVGTIGIGTVPATNLGIRISSLTLTGSVNQYGVYSAPTIDSSGTGVVAGIFSKLATSAAAFTVGIGAQLYADSPALGAGSAITTMYGVYAENQGGAGRTNAYGVYIAAQSGAATLNIGLYNGGTSQLVGNVGINKAPTTTSKLSISGLPTSSAGLASGDVWSNSGVLTIVP